MRVRNRSESGRIAFAQRRGRLALRWLAVLPFLLGALIAPGLMLARGADDGVLVTLCADGGVVQMLVAADGQPLTQDDRHHVRHGAHDRCLWAVHAQPMLDGPALVFPAMAADAVALRHVPDPGAHLRRAGVLQPSARGPPILA